MKKISFILCYSFFLSGFSQESLITDEYYLNPFIINPAASGLENYRVVNASYKKQWVGIQDAPGIQLLSATARIGNFDFYNPKMMLNKTNFVTKNRIGLGACVFNDNNGPLSYQGIILSYAYHIPFRFSRLSFGLSGSVAQHLLNQTEFEAYVQADPSLSYNKERLIFPNTSFGIMYHNHKYYLGASIKQIIPLRSGFNRFIESKNDYFLMGGYKFHDVGIFDIEPSAMLKLEDYEKIYFDIHTKLYVYEFYWLALSYRSYNSITSQIGLKVIKNIYVAYSYEVNIGEITQYFTGTHQVNLGLNLGLRAVQGVRDYVKEKNIN